MVRKDVVAARLDKLREYLQTIRGLPGYEGADKKPGGIGKSLCRTAIGMTQALLTTNYTNIHE
jgi:hypothetical protein